MTKTQFISLLRMGNKMEPAPESAEKKIYLENIVNLIYIDPSQNTLQINIEPENLFFIYKYKFKANSNLNS